MSKETGIKYLEAREKNREKKEALNRVVWVLVSLIVYNYGIGIKFADNEKDK
jgi:hypothetical protein